MEGCIVLVLLVCVVAFIVWRVRRGDGPAIGAVAGYVPDPTPQEPTGRRAPSARKAVASTPTVVPSRTDKKSLIDTLEMLVMVMGTGDWVFAASNDPSKPLDGHHLRVTVEQDGDQQAYVVECLNAKEYEERASARQLIVMVYYAYRVNGREYLAQGANTVTVTLEQVGDSHELVIPSPPSSNGDRPLPRRILEDNALIVATSRLLSRLSRVKLDVG